MKEIIMNEEYQNTRPDREGRSSRQINVRNFGEESGERKKRKNSSGRRSQNKPYTDRRRNKDFNPGEERGDKRRQTFREDGKARPEGDSEHSRGSRRRKPGSHSQAYKQEEQTRETRIAAEKSTESKSGRAEERKSAEERPPRAAAQNRGRGPENERAAQNSRPRKKKSWSECTVEELRAENERLAEEIHRQIDKFSEYHL